jgi:hypothetical protein
MMNHGMAAVSYAFFDESTFYVSLFCDMVASYKESDVCKSLSRGLGKQWLRP